MDYVDFSTLPMLSGATNQREPGKDISSLYLDFMGAGMAPDYSNAVQIYIYPYELFVSDPNAWANQALQYQTNYYMGAPTVRYEEGGPQYDPGQKIYYDPQDIIKAYESWIGQGNTPRVQGSKLSGGDWVNSLADSAASIVSGITEWMQQNVSPIIPEVIKATPTVMGAAIGGPIGAALGSGLTDAATQLTQNDGSIDLGQTLIKAGVSGAAAYGAGELGLGDYLSNLTQEAPDIIGSAATDAAYTVPYTEYFTVDPTLNPTNFISPDAVISSTTPNLFQVDNTLAPSNLLGGGEVSGLTPTPDYNVESTFDSNYNLKPVEYFIEDPTLNPENWLKQPEGYKPDSFDWEKVLKGASKLFNKPENVGGELNLESIIPGSYSDPNIFMEQILGMEGRMKGKNSFLGAEGMDVTKYMPNNTILNEIDKTYNKSYYV